MGDVSDYSRPAASGYVKALSDIKGVGPSKVKQWQHAEERFWKRKAVENAARQPGIDDASLVGGGQPGAVGGDDAKPADGQPAEPIKHYDHETATNDPGLIPTGETIDLEATDDPEGYQTETSKRIGERLKGQQGGGAA